MSTESNTANLPLSASLPENIISLNWSQGLIEELALLGQKNCLFDVIVINVNKAGFLFPADLLLEAGRLVPKLLHPKGMLVFANNNRAVALIKESLAGDLSLQIFDHLFQLYDYSPFAAYCVQQVINPMHPMQKSDLEEQVLMSAIPVLTQMGIKLKASSESSLRCTQLLATIDNYTPLSSIGQHLVDSTKMTWEEVLAELGALEKLRAIFPVFARVSFLTHCFRHQIGFNLKEYLLSSGILTPGQLDDIDFVQQQDNGKLDLGVQCVSSGYLSARQLEVMLKEVSFYGHNVQEIKPSVTDSTQSQDQSLVGHLGTTDPSGLLQILSTNRETGVLAVEQKDQLFRAVFNQGKITHASLRGITGNAAIQEFASAWREGAFVFAHREVPPDLALVENQVNKPLDKLLLDAALARDNFEVVLKKLPEGFKTVLEKLPDKEQLFSRKSIRDPRSSKADVILPDKSVQVMQRIWQVLGGLISLANAIKEMEDITTLEAITAVDRLLSLQLLTVPDNNCQQSLGKFRCVAAEIGKHIGQDRNIALLRLGLQTTQGYSAKSRIYTIGADAEVGIDLATARLTGILLTSLVRGLEDWQVKYVEYVSQEMDREILKQIIYPVHLNPNS